MLSMASAVSHGAEPSFNKKKRYGLLLKKEKHSYTILWALILSNLGALDIVGEKWVK